MTTQPEALRLADYLSAEEWPGGLDGRKLDKAATELRRQHDEIESLRQAYSIVTDDCRNLTEKVIPNIRAERDALLAVLKEAVECDGGDDGLFHACCGESFWTAHDVKCWVPKAKAAIDAARGET